MAMTSAAPKLAAPGVLVRDFIKRSLYEQGKGYFSQVDCVYSPPEPVDFRALQGHFGYINELDKLYKSRAESWLTPAEIFRPWYSRALGRYLLEKSAVGRAAAQAAGKGAKAKNDLRIVEIGGGNGTNALHVLDYIKECAPSVYARTKYKLIEISDAMAERQESLLGAAHPGRFEVVNEDFCSFQGHGEDGPCAVIALEVLDNLPHDKLVRKLSPASRDADTPWWIFKSGDLNEWHQTHVVPANENGDIFREDLRPLSDPLAIRAAEAFLGPHQLPAAPADAEAAGKKGSSLGEKLVNWARQSLAKGRLMSEQAPEDSAARGIFVPTGALQMIDTLAQKFPQHEVLAADFNMLPPPEISTWTMHSRRGEPGSVFGVRNAPLVASKNDKGNTVDHSTYLVPLGTADIFFQTDFLALQAAYKSVVGANAHAEMRTQSSFLREFADFAYTETRSGYNPMLEDYHNMDFFIGSSVGSPARK
ncbi:Protein arginine methyltransferase NDUFAF7-like, mitochondrial [Hondaea fermentalgiana]|uniref:Protein arginine methyltransferase NDUFAF7 n=1 Tax=Hondaea fermentalgiana TaxID=2315210 RepID=A0A2R5GN24_9STRA|nr:Protein arginine methyltransferase NDUFAF7-like, mitochondrial [Hondaea fermentalgiana]|eukprot:GBG30023.1 Protein arginine methyltransferase NDUFAF7-like, mitochondrial [Hondaea fermentalgiana]